MRKAGSGWRGGAGGPSTATRRTGRSWPASGCPSSDPPHVPSAGTNGPRCSFPRPAKASTMLPWPGNPTAGESSRSPASAYAGSPASPTSDESRKSHPLTESQAGAMTHTSVDVYLVIDTFLLLLIGIGPKIALVPFVEITAPLDSATKALIVRKMLTTAAVVALILLGLGELLSRLLHFSTGSLSIAGGIILVIIAITMVLGTGEPGGSDAISERDPIRIAVFPLAVPYLLNPAGIVALVTLSAEADSVAVFAMV